MSGIGLYYSLYNLYTIKKNNINLNSNKRFFEWRCIVGEVIHWEIRRYKRILIPYLTFAIPCYLLIAVNNDWTICKYLFNLSTLSYWTTHWGLWFIALLLPLYLVAPILYKLVTQKEGVIWAISIVLICIAIGAFDFDINDKNIIHNVLTVVLHIPSFVIGLFIGQFTKKGKTISLSILTNILIVLFFITYAIFKLTGVNTTNNFMIAIPITTITVMVIDMLNSNVLIKLLDFMGSISLESYCTNVFAVSWFFIIPKGSLFYMHNITNYMIGVFCCILLSILINRVSNYLIFKLKTI